MKTSLVALIALMLSAPLAQAADTQQGMKNQLDGTKWTIKAISIKEGDGNFDETLSFNDDKLSLGSSDPTVTSKEGFLASSYTTNVEKGRRTFTAQLRSEKKGTATYNGFITGDNMSGTVDAKHLDGKKIRYNFSGSKVTE